MKNCLPAILLFFALFYANRTNAQCDFTEVEIITTTVNWGSELGWEILDEENNILESFQADADNSTYTSTLCLEDACYFLHATDAYGDGWNGGAVEIIIGDISLNYALETGAEGIFPFGVNTEGCVVEIAGCTDPNAVNYNPLATIDDGSCTTIAGILDDQSITLLLESGPKDNRINWAIQNRGMPNSNDEFNSEEEFVSMLQDSILPPFTVGSYLEKTPYARYRNFFNIYAWWWPDAPSQETGWSWQILKGIRDLYFLPWADDEHGWATLFSISKYGGGGGAGVQPETRTGDGLMFGTGWETLLHEFGHTMPQVPDEYTSSGEWSGGNCWESANTTAHAIKDSIPWRKWIADDTPLPTPYVGENLNKIGAFEGALTNYFGCHRPTARGCYMGAGGFGWGYGQDLCPPCRQRVICHLYRYVDVIENPMPASTELEVSGSQTITFSADIIKPEPNSQVYTWLLNGKVIATGVEEVAVEFGACNDYELTLTVEDTTSWVRYDEHFDHIYPRPFESHTWHIDQLLVDSYDLNIAVDVTDADCTGADNGTVEFTATGGTAPYEAHWEGQNMGTSHEGLQEGEYNYWLLDAEGCGIPVNATVGAAPELEAEICASFDDSWSLSVSVNGYPEDDLTYLWSTGATSPTVEGLPDGDYSVAVQSSTYACQVESNINLTAPDAPLNATHELIPSTDDGDKGAIYLNITGGNPAYSIRWYDKAFEDLTVPDPETVEASGTNFDHLPIYAFDNDLYTKWLQLGDAGLWLSTFFENGEVIRFYTVTSGDDVEERDPKDWRFEASNDGENWVVLDVRTNEDFPSRRQKKRYEVSNETSYQYYRFYITANSGADAIQLQELEFMGANSQADFVYRPEADDQAYRLELPPGEYRYVVTDQNSSCASDTLSVLTIKSFIAAGLKVVQESNCSVTIEAPNPDYTYYWLGSEAGDQILAIGLSFTPPASGNYWVAAVDAETGAMSDNRQGFAVSMPEQPIVVEIEEGILGLENPDPELTYFWYTESCGGTPVHQGTTFTPGPDAEQYWVSSWWATPFPEATNPATLPGLVIRMDAADLNGDGAIDEPAPLSSSLYDWSFTPDNQWSDGSWFAFRGNYQNGLGIADFATMWYQCIEEGFSDYRTVIMAYKENALSWQGTAPFYGLSDRIPYSAQPDQQLYLDDAPPSTLNGKTYYNGQAVDPLSTPNTMDFSILAQTFTSPAGSTNCTDTHWEGIIGELIFYEQALSDEELIGISEFLRKKWISTADLESPRTEVNWDGMMVGVHEAVQDKIALKVVPNPSNGSATLFIEGDYEKITFLEVFDLYGQSLFKAPMPAGQNYFQLDRALTSYPDGMYLIVASTNAGKRYTTKAYKMKY
jgi:hypothetical protein